MEKVKQLLEQRDEESEIVPLLKVVRRRASTRTSRPVEFGSNRDGFLHKFLLDDSLQGRKLASIVIASLVDEVVAAAFM